MLKVFFHTGFFTHSIVTTPLQQSTYANGPYKNEMRWYIAGRRSYEKLKRCWKAPIPYTTWPISGFIYSHWPKCKALKLFFLIFSHLDQKKINLAYNKTLYSNTKSSSFLFFGSWSRQLYMFWLLGSLNTFHLALLTSFMFQSLHYYLSASLY